MKRTLLCLCAALLCTACSPTAEPSAPSAPVGQVQGSSMTRYPSDGSGAETQFGPKEESAMPVLTEDSAVASLAAGGDLGQAIDSIGGNGFVLIEKGEHRIAADVTVPADTVLLFADGAMLCPDKGVTLTVDGFVSGTYRQLFGGEGRVVGSIRNEGVPHWFGSLSGEDDSAVMQKAVDALQMLLLPQGENYNFKDIVIGKPIRISGVGSNKTTVRQHGRAKCLFDIRSSDVCIRDLKVEGAVKGTTFYFNTDETHIRRVTLYNIWVKNVEHCVSDAKSGGKYTICDVNLVDVRVDAPRAEGYYLSDFRTGIRFDGVQSQNLGASFTVLSPGMVFDGVQEMYAADIDITGGRPQDTKAHGLVLRNCQNVTLDRSMMEYTNGYALWLDNCRNVKVEHYVLCGYNDAALRVSDCEGITFNLMLITGTYFPDGDAETFPLYFPESAHGAYISDSSNIVFNTLALQRCAGKGLILEKVDGCVFNAFTSWYVRDELLVQDADCSGIVWSGQVKDK